MRRVELLLGAPLAKVHAAAIATLAAGSVREDSDLEFKQQLYGNNDDEKRALAGDVAALVNPIGGVYHPRSREGEWRVDKIDPNRLVGSRGAPNAPDNHRPTCAGPAL